MKNEAEISKKYSEVFQLSKEAFQEELARCCRLDDKASKYFSVATGLVAIYGFSGYQIIGIILPVTSILDTIILIIGAITWCILIYVWISLLATLRIDSYKKIPLDFNFYKKTKLIDIHYTMSEALEDGLKFNRNQGNKKAKWLHRAYTSIIVLVITLIIFSSLLIAKKTFLQKEETQAMSNGTPQEIFSNEEVDYTPPPEVERPTLDMVTEGFSNESSSENLEIKDTK